MIRPSIVVAGLCLLAAGAAHAADVGQNEKIEVTPAQGRVGMRFELVCKDFPEPASGDMVYVVPAGTPDIDPASPTSGDAKVLWKDYAANCYTGKGHFYSKAGPFAPGNYEARFSTDLYNNDHRKDTATHTAFSVR